VVTLLIVGLLGGCRGGQPVQTSSRVTEPVDLGPDEPTAALPAEFDTSLPIFPGAKVEHVRRPKGSMREIFLSSDATDEKLIQFYKDALEKNGYQVTATMRVAARRTWSCDFHKGGRQASVLLFPSDTDKSRITIDLIYEMAARGDERPPLPEEQFDVVGPGEVAQQTADSSEKRN
jgi:hypothetical protein